MLMGVFLLLSRMLWDRRIATSSRHNRQSALDSIYYIAANKPHPCNCFYEYSLKTETEIKKIKRMRMTVCIVCTLSFGLINNRFRFVSVPGGHFCRLRTRLGCEW